MWLLCDKLYPGPEYINRVLSVSCDLLSPSSHIAIDTIDPRLKMTSQDFPNGEKQGEHPLDLERQRSGALVAELPKSIGAGVSASLPLLSTMTTNH